MKPSALELAEVCVFAATLLGVQRAWCFDGRVYLRLDENWHLAISPDDAQRFRMEACFRGRLTNRMWCLTSDRARAADLIFAARDEVLALA